MGIHKDIKNIVNRDRFGIEALLTSVDFERSKEVEAENIQTQGTIRRTCWQKVSQRVTVKLYSLCFYLNANNSENQSVNVK